MAFTMKHWLGAVFAGFAIVAIWNLPPSLLSTDDYGVMNAEQLRSKKVEHEYRVTAEVYRRVVWTDSLLPLVTAPTAPEVDVLYLADESLPEAQKARYLERVESEVRALEPSGDVRFALVLLDRSLGVRSDMGPGVIERAEYFAGEEHGQKYCMLVRPVESRRIVRTVAQELARTDRATPVSNSIGLCALYVRHGMPGSNIQQWISGGAATLGQERGYDDRTDLRIPARSFFGRRWGNRPFHLDRCIARDASSCAEAFQIPRGLNEIAGRNVEIVAKSHAVWIGSWSSYQSIAADDAFMLADLEEEFGRDAFTAFWTSDAEVLPAFQDAFGLSAGEWVVSWISERYEVEGRGATLNRAATSGSVLMILLMLLFAFSHQRRRTVVS